MKYFSATFKFEVFKPPTAMKSVESPLNDKFFLFVYIGAKFWHIPEYSLLKKSATVTIFSFTSISPPHTYSFLFV